MVLVILPHVGQFRAFEEVDVLYALKCKLLWIKPWWTSGWGSDAMALSDVAAGYVETVSDSRELGHGVLLLRELRSNQFPTHEKILSLSNVNA